MMNEEYRKILENDHMFYISAVREIYKAMDLGHNEKHFDEVYLEACKLATYDYLVERITKEELRYTITAAAYHDIGRIINNKNHEQYSVDIIKNYNSVKNLLVDFDESVVSYVHDNFTEMEISIICKIILQHRSKATATTEMAAIVKDADKISRTDYNRFLYRIIAYNINTIKEGLISCGDFKIMTNRAKEVLKEYIDRHEKGSTIEMKSLSKAAKEIGEKAPIKLLEMPSDDDIHFAVQTVYFDWLKRNKNNA